VRWLTVLILLLLPTVALAKPKAKPKVAVAPLDDDSDDKVGKILVEVASDHAKVVGLEKTKRAIDDLGVSLDKKGLQKLRVKLEVELVIHGAVVKDGTKKSVELELSGHGRAKAKLTVSARSPNVLRAELTKSLAKKIEEVEAIEAPSSGDDDDDDATATPVATEDKPKHSDDDHPKRLSDDDRPKPTRSDDSGDRPHKRVASSGDDDSSDTSVHATSGRHHRHHEGVEAPRNLPTQGWLFLDAGIELSRRTLRFNSNNTEPEPPWVGTAGAAPSIGGEVYPLAQDSPSGAGGLGLYGSYAKVVGVSIAVPMTTVKSSVDSGHMEFGARYRIPIGTASSLAVGAGYWERYYHADQSQVVAPAMLDMPDVTYKALAPSVVYRFASGPSFAGFAEVEVPLVFSVGSIGNADSYGRGTAIGFDLQAGFQYLVTDHVAIDLAAGYDQVGISFSAETGSEAANRGVTSSSDKVYGITASVGIFY
jgi:hypothetical protein